MTQARGRAGVNGTPAHGSWGAGRLGGLLLVVCHALLSVVVLACSSIDCPVQNTVSVQYAVRNAAGADTLRDTLYVLTRRADGSDTLLLNRGVGLTAFSLPISYAHPEDTLFFLTRDTLLRWTLDTLWMKKDDIPHFESVDCSAHFFHRITGVRSTHSAIDSVTINNPSVDYDQSRTHLHIYFKSR